MTRLTPGQLAELRRLFQESTQGEWFAFRSTVANVAKWTIQIARGWLFVQSDKATQTDCVWASEAHNHFEALLAAAENEARLRGFLDRIDDAVLNSDDLYYVDVVRKIGAILSEWLIPKQEPTDAH